MRVLLVLAISIFVIGCDQSSKSIAERTHSETGDQHFLGGTVQFRYSLNPGGFLGLGGQLGSTARFWFFTLGPAVGLLFFVAWSLVRDLPLSQVMGLALVFGGGVGNLIDRVVLSGVVRDFAFLTLGPLRTGIFNLADVAILLGTVVVLFSGLVEIRLGNGNDPESRSASA
jgi:signal peptidase II